MNERTKNAIKGAIIGATGGVAAVIPMMVFDITAPISYPVYGATVGFIGVSIDEDQAKERGMSYNGIGKPEAMALCVAGMTIGVIVAPLNFIIRPIATPVLACAAGAVFGVILTKEGE